MLRATEHCKWDFPFGIPKPIAIQPMLNVIIREHDDSTLIPLTDLVNTARARVAGIKS